jgi:hypothetical protein
MKSQPLLRTKDEQQLLEIQHPVFQGSGSWMFLCPNVLECAADTSNLPRSHDLRTTSLRKSWAGATNLGEDQTTRRASSRVMNRPVSQNVKRERER